MLDPFSPNKGKSTPAKKSWEEALVQKPKGGGSGSKSKAEDGASKKLAEEAEEDFKKDDKVKDPPSPLKPEVVLSNPKWNAGPAYFDETMGASVEGMIPAEIAHLTRVAFTVNAKSPDGKTERIDVQDGHLANGKASAVLTLWSPPFKDPQGKPVLQADYSFKGNNPIDNDMFGNFPAPEWKAGRAQTDQAPVAYARGQKIALGAKFAVDVQPSVAEPVEVSAKAKFGSASLGWTGTVIVNPGDTQVTLTLASDHTLPNEVGRFETTDIAWQMKPKGQSAASAGTSRNLVYVTLGNPSGTPNYWTLLDISCNGAAGAKDEDTLVKESFKPFTHTLGDGKGFRRKRDGLELTYYKMGGRHSKLRGIRLLGSVEPRGRHGPLWGMGSFSGGHASGAWSHLQCRYRRRTRLGQVIHRQKLLVHRPRKPSGPFYA